MPELTPAERRGARWFMVLLLVGTLHDWTRAIGPSWAPPAALPGPAPPPADPSRSGPAAELPARATADAANVTELNQATVAELDRLPGIGPVLARRIVEHRERHGPFRSPDELLGVPGIGSRLLEKMRPHVYVVR